MITVSGKHFIFTRVEKEYSPKNEGGFQVYYSSKEISDIDLQVLVAAVNCFSPKDSNIARKQYFRLPSQNFAFINTIAENHPEISDRKRRTGSYLAHGIILEPQQFSKILFNPFKVFDGFNFLGSAEDMVRDFNQLENRESSNSFEIDPYAPIEGGEFFTDRAISLYQIALTSTKKNGELQLVGQSDEVDAFFRSMLQFSHPSMRSSCTFDTHAESCQIPSGLFWAIGASFKRDGAQNTINLSRNIPNPDFKLDIKEDLYYQWLRNVVDTDSKDAYRFSSTAQLLTIALHKNESIPDANLDIEASQSFYQIHKSLFLQRLDNTIGNLTSALIAKKLISFMLKSQIDIRKLLSVAASQSASYAFLSPILRKMIEVNAPKFDDWKKGDWIKLQDYAKRANDMLILFWASALGKDSKTRLISCKTISEGDYRLSLSLMSMPLEPKDFIPSSGANMKHLMVTILPLLDDMGNQVFAEFVVELYANNFFEFIDAMASKVSMIDNKSLTQLEAKLALLPKDSIFLRSMQAKRKELGRPEGIKGIFYRVKK